MLRHIYLFLLLLFGFGVFPEEGISFCIRQAINFHPVIYECAEGLGMLIIPANKNDSPFTVSHSCMRVDIISFLSDWIPPSCIFIALWYCMVGMLSIEDFEKNLEN